MRRLFGGLAIAAVLLGTAACEGNQPGGATNATNAPAAPAAPPVQPGAAGTLTPGTPEYILANQPDASGDLKVTAGLVNVQAKLWRKGGKLRVEGDAGQMLTNLQGKGKVVMLTEPGKPTVMINVDQKKYYEAPVTAAENPGDYVAQYVKNWREKGWTVQQVGEETLEGHPVTKYRIAPPGGSAAGAVTNAAAPPAANANATTNTAAPATGNDEVFAYVAKDLNNLVIRLDGRVENQPFRVDLSNATIEVPDTAFAAPAGFPTGYTKVADARELFSPGGASAPAGAAPPANANR